MNLQVDVLKVGSAVIVSVVGDLDAYTSPRLKRTLTEIAGGGPSRVEVQLREVDILDSFGMGSLIAGIRAIESVGGSVSTSVSRRVARNLELVGLGPSLRISAETNTLSAAG